MSYCQVSVLSKQERKVYDYLVANGSASAHEIQQILDTKTPARIVIARMRNKKRIPIETRQVPGKGRSSRYCLTQKLTNPPIDSMAYRIKGDIDKLCKAYLRDRGHYRAFALVVIVGPDSS